jgi:uncharacterized protein YndB with AHSA1/START domain
MAARTDSNEIKLTRVYDVPVRMVWAAWTDDQQVGQWWGPRGFTITTHSKDIRTGGHWHYTMHGPDGIDYANKTQYLEVKEGSKLVYDHGGNDERKPLFRVTALFKDVGGKTQLDMTMGFATSEEAENSRKFIKKAGGNATWDRLAEYLGKRSLNKELFVINRAFDVPVERMFEVWTDPSHLAQWMGPTGSTMEFIRVDIRSGGNSFYRMEHGGHVMFGKADYLKVEKPHLIVYTQQFCDEKGKTSRHPMAPTWPETMHTTVQFSEEASDRTRVTVTWEVVGKTSPEEMATFIQGRAGMTGGWTGSFDKLEEYLAQGGKA